MCATNSNKYDNKPSYLPVYAVHCGALQYNTMQWEGVQGGRDGESRSVDPFLSALQCGVCDETAAAAAMARHRLNNL